MICSRHDFYWILFLSLLNVKCILTVNKGCDKSTLKSISLKHFGEIDRVFAYYPYKLWRYDCIQSSGINSAFLHGLISWLIISLNSNIGTFLEFYVWIPSNSQDLTCIIFNFQLILKTMICRLLQIIIGHLYSSLSVFREKTFPEWQATLRNNVS